jgi:hypothetical protein
MNINDHSSVTTKVNKKKTNLQEWYIIRSWPFCFQDFSGELSALDKNEKNLNF